MEQFIQLIGGPLDGKRVPMHKVFTPDQYWTNTKDLEMFTPIGLAPYKFDRAEMGDDETAFYAYDGDSGIKHR